MSSRRARFCPSCLGCRPATTLIAVSPHRHYQLLGITTAPDTPSSATVTSPPPSAQNIIGCCLHFHLRQALKLVCLKEHHAGHGSTQPHQPAGGEKKASANRDTSTAHAKSHGAHSASFPRLAAASQLSRPIAERGEGRGSNLHRHRYRGDNGFLIAPVWRL